MKALGLTVLLCLALAASGRRTTKPPRDYLTEQDFENAKSFDDAAQMEKLSRVFVPLTEGSRNFTGPAPRYG